MSGDYAFAVVITLGAGPAFAHAGSMQPPPCAERCIERAERPYKCPRRRDDDRDNPECERLIGRDRRHYDRRFCIGRSVVGNVRYGSHSRQPLTLDSPSTARDSATVDSYQPSLVTLRVERGIAWIEMNDPARRNALGRVMMSELTRALEMAAGEARVVVLRAATGMSVWCAGFDIDDLSPGFDPLSQSGPLQGLFRAVQDCPAPVIAMLASTAWGGGTDLALRCDIAVASPRCTLAFTPARLGLPYDPEGLLNVLLRGGLGLAMEMFATGDAIPATRALGAGLLNHVVPDTELEGFTLAMAERIASNAPLSVASAKRQLRAMNAALPLAPAVLQGLLEGRQAALRSADFAEGLAAFREKRQPDFSGR